MKRRKKESQKLISRFSLNVVLVFVGLHVSLESEEETKSAIFMTAELAEAEAAARTVDAHAPPPTAAVAADANLADATVANAAPAISSELTPASAAAPAVAEPTAAAAEGKTAQLGEKGANGIATDAAAALPNDAAPPTSTTPTPTATTTTAQRAKKKFALFVAYVGAGFAGMQYNKDQTTIEGTLRDALVAAGLIAQANADAFSKVAWSRAARTDKGVSAVGQVVALRLLVPPQEEGGDAAIARLANERLPPAIRVLGASQVRSGFDARKSCDRRRYEYVLPEFAFDPAACCARADEKARKSRGGGGEGAAREGGDGGAEGEEEAPGAEKEEEEAPAEAAAAEAAETATAPAPAKEKEGEEKEKEAPEQQQEAKAPFVFDDAAKAKLNSILAQYEGTHK